jgi:hypothetical protein
VTRRGRILGHSRQRYIEDQRRFGRALGFVAGLVILYLVAHHVWLADEPGRVVWAGPLGVAIEWTWWAGIGAAAHGLTLAARSFYRPAEASRFPANRWPGLLLVVSTALLVLILFTIGAIVRVGGPAAIVALCFDRPSAEILVPVAFVLGFFHRLGVACYQHVAHNTWEALKRAVVSLPGWWQRFWEGVRAMWQSLVP